MSLIDPASVPPLAERYPRAPGRFRHNLAADQSFALAALTKAGRALPERHITYWGETSSANGTALAPPASVLAAGGQGPRGIRLSAIQQLPPYRALLTRLLAELGPILTRATGPVHNLGADVLIAWSSMRTSMHFAARYMLLFQISGDRLLAAYPPTPPFLDLARREAYQCAGEDRLEWQPDFAMAGEQHVLEAGDGLFMPHAAPHWVHSGDGPSVALAVSWQCRRTRAEADALALNPVLRRMGLTPYDPATSPAAPLLRAAASRVGRRIGLM